MRGRLIDGEAGQSTLEMALALPVLLMVLLGVVQFALVHHARSVVMTAAQEGARFAAAEERTAMDGIDRARGVLQSGLGPTGAAFDVAGWTTPESAIVEVTGAYPLTIPWVASEGIPLRATADVRKEEFRSGP